MELSDGPALQPAGECQELAAIRAGDEADRVRPQIRQKTDLAACGQVPGRIPSSIPTASWPSAPMSPSRYSPRSKPRLLTNVRYSRPSATSISRTVPRVDRSRRQTRRRWTQVADAVGPVDQPCPSWHPEPAQSRPPQRPLTSSPRGWTPSRAPLGCGRRGGDQDPTPACIRRSRPGPVPPCNRRPIRRPSGSPCKGPTKIRLPPGYRSASSPETVSQTSTTAACSR